MRVGLTFDLRSAYLAEGYGDEETAEFDRDVTIDALEATLRELGHEPERIGHARQLMAALLAGRRWDLVFNIAESLRGSGREALVPAILDQYEIPYTFSDPLVCALTLDKGMTKRVVRDAGLATSPFLVVAAPADIEALDFGPPYFAKPVAEGTSKGIGPASVARSVGELRERCAALLAEFRQPVLVERYLSGREFTTAILGTGREARAIGTMEVLLRGHAEAGVYSYHNKENSEELVDYALRDPGSDPLAEAVVSLALAAWRLLGCRDAGRVDTRCDETGLPQFLEVNPLAGLHPHHSDVPIICGLVGMSYRDLIGSIVASAARRAGLGA